VSLRTNIKLYSFDETAHRRQRRRRPPFKKSIIALTPTTLTTINNRANTHDTHHLSTRTPARLAPPASVTVAAAG